MCRFLCNPLAAGGFDCSVLLCTAALCDLSCIIFMADFCKPQLQTCFSFREMATTFARLCQQVDVTQKNLEKEIARLSKEIDQLENIQSHSKQLRWVCMWLPGPIPGTADLWVDACCYLQPTSEVYTGADTDTSFLYSEPNSSLLKS